ncbi:MAG: DUF2723 domain-containing protein [Deltaproteobacteria bacterium]|nr:DUF2723 domain-containing protein [Deltaproteobacteria bacterium]
MEGSYHRVTLRRWITDVMVRRGGWVVLATLGLYLWVAPSTIMTGDNADFAAVGAVGGSAHPSGYPLYVMWLRLWSWLPGTPAHAAAVATVMLSAAVIFVLHAACRAWGARPLAASIAVALFATAPIVLRIHTEADVFPLNCLICATVVWLSAAEGPLRGTRRAAVLALIAGLGLAHNLTCVLVAPIGILGFVRGMREANALGRTIALSLGAFVLGLVPYAYLFVAGDTPVSWGSVDSFGELVHHVMRRDYGVFKLSNKGDGLAIGKNIVAFGASVGRAYLWIPALVGVVALGISLVRPHGHEPRSGWIALAASFVLAGPVFAAMFNRDPVNLGLYLVQRFHLQAMMVFAVFVAVGLDRIGTEIEARTGGRYARIAPLLAVASFVIGAALSLPFVARVHTPAVERGLRNMLGSLPPAAIVIGSTDELHFGAGYLQFATGLRPDVTVISAGQLGLSYYRDRLARRTGIVVVKPRDAAEKVTVTVAEQALATGRPVFIDPFQGNIAVAFPTYPYGLVFRVLPRGTALPSIDAIFAMNKLLFERYDFGYSFPGPDDQFATQYHVIYVRTWTAIWSALSPVNHREERAFAQSMIDALSPR